MKTVIMNFADGPKPIKVGQTCVTYNRYYGGKIALYNYTVAKIGRKYVEMTNGDKFELETGKEKTAYTRRELYSSKEAYEKHTHIAEERLKLANRMRNFKLRDIGIVNIKRLNDLLDEIENKPH